MWNHHICMRGKFSSGNYKYNVPMWPLINKVKPLIINAYLGPILDNYLHTPRYYLGVASLGPHPAKWNEKKKKTRSMIVL